MIVAEALTKYYGLKPAIRDVSFRVEKGEIVGFLGPNGAGKTTILRILTCFMPPTSGQVLVDGLSTRTRSLEVRAKIGFLPENVPLYNDLSVKRFLAFAGSVKGLKKSPLRDEIQRVTHVCGLDEHLMRLIRHLSKGLKQRVGLAQALLGDPSILILDEPTTGLDPAQIVEIRQLIRSLGRERTVLLSTHILPEVSQVCNRVIIVNKGGIIAENTPEALTAQTQKGSRTTLRIDGPQSEIGEKLLSVEGVSKVEGGVRRGEFIVESGSDERTRPRLARAVVEAGWGLQEMRARDLSLEEVFVQLVTEEDGANGSEPPQGKDD
jgi:ABC-2 type transport system ATP-binding protein